MWLLLRAKPPQPFTLAFSLEAGGNRCEPGSAAELRTKTLPVKSVAFLNISGDAYSSTFNNQRFRVGQRFSVEGMQVTVERVSQGRPMRTRFVFDLPLDDPRVLPLMQTRSGLARFAVPAVGRAMMVPPPDLPYDLLPFADAGLALLPETLTEIVHH